MNISTMFYAKIALCGLCILGAIILAIQSKNGWGWLLFVAVILSPSVSGVVGECNKTSPVVKEGTKV